MKKIIAFLMALCLLLAGAMSALAEAPYEATLMYIVANDAAPGLQNVEDKLNELTIPALNTKVTLMPVTLGTYRQQAQLMLAGAEPLDLLPIVTDDAGTYVDALYLVDLKDYLQYAPDACTIIGEDVIASASINGYIWGFPTMMERTNVVAMVMRTDILNELGIDPASIKTLEDITVVFGKVHEAYPDMTVYGGSRTASLPTLSNHVDTLGDRIGVLDHYGTDDKVTNYYESQGYIDLVNVVRDWYLQGYVSKDLATSQTGGEQLMKAGNLFAFSVNAKPDTEAEKERQTGYDVTVVELNEKMLTTWSSVLFGYGVSASCEDPKKAVELYNWIVNTPAACDLLNWGVEGVDWVEAADGTATFPEGVTSDNVSYHQGMGFGQPNQQNAHVWEGGDPNVWESYRKAQEEARASEALGFTFDKTPVIDAYTACYAVKEQYDYTIASGSVDPEEAIPEFNEALYDAGLQDVIDEKQRQLDAWKEANGK